MSTNKFGRIIANTRPTGLDIHLDGRSILDSSGKIAKTPTIILNVSAGLHNVTFSKLGYDTTTITINVQEGSYCHARAILATKLIRYPMMLGRQNHTIQKKIQTTQPSPGWPALPIPQIPFGYLVANTIPDGAEIYIDNKPVFDTVGKILTTPASVLGIVVGKHTVTFKKKGFSDANIEVYIENGLYSDASTVLIPIMTGLKPIALIPVKGEITIDSTPSGAQIYIDSRLIVDNEENPIKTPTKLILDEGWHDMVLYLEKYCRESGLVYVYPDTHSYVHKDLYTSPC